MERSLGPRCPPPARPAWACGASPGAAVVGVRRAPRKPGEQLAVTARREESGLGAGRAGEVEGPPCQRSCRPGMCPWLGADRARARRLSWCSAEPGLGGKGTTDLHCALASGPTDD